MAVDSIPVRLEVGNIEARKTLERIIISSGGFHLIDYPSPHHDELFIFEIGENLEKEFHIVESLVGLETVGEVFLTSRVTEPTVLVQALRSGAREFLQQPIREEEVRRALEGFRERRAKGGGGGRSQKSGKIISVMGSKGGVGVTSVAVNLAANLQMKESKSVALIDMNLLFGEVPLFLDMEPAYSWGEIVENIYRLDTTFLMTILHKHSSGIHVLPSPTRLDTEHYDSPDVMKSLLDLMRATFDFTIIDAGQPSDDISLRILRACDTVLLVSILSLPCLANVKKILNLFYDLGYPPIENVKVVINRYLNNCVIPLKEAEQSMNHEVFWMIPNDFGTTMTAINQGKVLCEVDAKKPVTKSIDQLARALAGGPSDTRKESTLFGRIFGRKSS